MADIPLYSYGLQTVPASTFSYDDQWPPCFFLISDCAYAWTPLRHWWTTTILKRPALDLSDILFQSLLSSFKGLQHVYLSLVFLTVRWSSHLYTPAFYMTFLRTLRLASAHPHSDIYKGRQPMLLSSNPFLVTRFVLLGLLFNFALISLIFAAWNINATIAFGVPTYSSAIFITFQSCLTFCGITLALADLFYRSAHTSRTLVECGWIGVLAVLQLGGAIGSVIASEESFCDIEAAHNICISNSLLVPTTWLGAFVAVAYFLALFIVTISHKPMYPDIWLRTIYSIPWFDASARIPRYYEKEKANKKIDDRTSYAGSTFGDSAVYAAFYNDTESLSNHKPSSPKVAMLEPAPWAVPTRRGIDPPFVRKPAKAWGLSPTTAASSTAKSPASSRIASSPPRIPPKDFTLPALPTFPERSANPFVPVAAPTSGSRFVERFRDSGILIRSPRDVGDAGEAAKQHQHARTSSFPLSVLDLDEPIPLTRLSEWVAVTDKERYDVPRGALFGH